MIRPNLPAGVVPAGATHFYYDAARPTEAPNPWRRLDAEGKWHMLRGDTWNPIAGSNSHRFYPVVNTLNPIGADEMTLRDYFAAKAMNGMYCDLQRPEMSYAECAKCAYEMADAMMTAREVQP